MRLVLRFAAVLLLVTGNTGGAKYMPLLWNLKALNLLAFLPKGRPLRTKLKHKFAKRTILVRRVRQKASLFPRILNPPSCRQRAAAQRKRTR
jgi:hypothetical protein